MAGKWRRLAVLMALFIVAPTLSVEIEQSKQTKIENVVSNAKVNKIPYLDNRFRIDANIDEVTMVFYRVKGTMPIILVQPDGSKITALNYPHETVNWYDDVSYDMVTIKKPMPGPWQVLGDIDPTSRIMVLSDIELQVDNLPKVLLAGETLKVQARVTNGGEPITVPQFAEVISLKVSFQSTNNPDYDNFAAGIYQIADILDDGLNLDERARDGVFTGEFKLNLPAGEWQPIYTVIMPNLVREIFPDKLILHDAPFKFSVERSNNEKIPHKIFIEIDDKELDTKTMAFQGMVLLPNKLEVPFAITEPSEEKVRKFELDNKWVGIHRVRTNVFGNTKDGREFMLTLGEFAFNVELPPEPKPVMDPELMLGGPGADELSLLMDGELLLEPGGMKEPDTGNDTMIWLGIIFGNLLLVTFFILGYWVLVHRKAK